jgi:hypothetical protein
MWTFPSPLYIKPQGLTAKYYGILFIWYIKCFLTDFGGEKKLRSALQILRQGATVRQKKPTPPWSRIEHHHITMRELSVLNRVNYYIAILV